MLSKECFFLMEYQLVDAKSKSPLSYTTSIVKYDCDGDVDRSR